MADYVQTSGDVVPEWLVRYANSNDPLVPQPRPDLVAPPRPDLMAPAGYPGLTSAPGFVGGQTDLPYAPPPPPPDAYAPPPPPTDTTAPAPVTGTAPIDTGTGTFAPPPPPPPSMPGENGPEGPTAPPAPGALPPEPPPPAPPATEPYDPSGLATPPPAPVLPPLPPPPPAPPDITGYRPAPPVGMPGQSVPQRGAQGLARLAPSMPGDISGYRGQSPLWARGIQRSPYRDFAQRNAVPFAPSMFGRREDLYPPPPDPTQFGVGVPPWQVLGG